VGLRGSPWGDTVAAWTKEGYPMHKVTKEPGEMRWRGDGKREEVTEAGEYVEPVPTWEHFGYDMTALGGWIDVFPLRDHSQLEEETEAWEVRRNGAGAALKYWKHKSGTPEHIDFRMTTRGVWERDYRPHLLELDPDRVDVKSFAENLARCREAGVWAHVSNLFIWEMMRQSMGDVTLYQSLALDPDWVHDYSRVYTDFFKAHYTYLFENAGLPDGAWISEDLGYKNGLFASPRTLKELIFPYFAELVAFFHTHDLPTVLHTCGSVAEAMPLIIEAGFDAVHPMERKALNNEPFVFAERYGEEIAFVGGLDARVIETNDKETIRREVADYVEGMKARGARLVFCSDHSISTNSRYDSYCHALEVYREHMMY
jgi:uroporphyrinogen decarboxylase